MLVGRLSDLEASVKEGLEKQSLDVRHAHSLLPPGTPFSGVMHSGRAVTLRVHGKFDAEGRIDKRNNHAVIIMTNQDLMEDCRVFWDEEQPDSEWDADVIAAWGPTKYATVRANAIAFAKTTSFSTSCHDAGLMNHGHEYLGHQVYETGLRQRLPTLLAIGNEGIVVSDSDIQAAVHTMEKVTNYLRLPSSTKLDIFVVDTSLLPLAMAMIRGFGEKKAYTALSAASQKRVRSNVDCSWSFVTRERLDRCM